MPEGFGSFTATVAVVSPVARLCKYEHRQYFGLQIRRELRDDVGLRRWIDQHTTLDVQRPDGSTVVKLKRNPNPTRTEFDGVFS